jgi:hypothetical protein
MRPDDGRPTEVETALGMPRLTDGAVVVYFDPEPAGDSSFCRAVATGPEIVDPRTHDRWAPVMRPDRTLDLVPFMLIVRVGPAA